MKTLIFISLVTLFTSCKKYNPSDVFKKNEINATVVLKSGSTINLNAKGAKANMGCSFGGGSYVNLNDDPNPSLYMSYINGTSCVSSTGTYNYSCGYRPNGTSSPIYSNYRATNPGSITYTIYNDHYMEGMFNSVCVSDIGTDSVIVSGTFKGYHY